MAIGLKICFTKKYSDGDISNQIIWYYHNHNKNLSIKDRKKKKRIFEKYKYLILDLEKSNWSYLILEKYFGIF